MLPVGIRNASITNARNTKASMKAVISHSNVFAISTTLSLRAAFLGLIFSVLFTDINAGCAVKRILYRLHQKSLTETPKWSAQTKKVFFELSLTSHRKTTEPMQNP
jgi:hypothetical protein